MKLKSISKKNLYLYSAIFTFLFLFFQNCSRGFQAQLSSHDDGRNISSVGGVVSSDTLFLTSAYKDAAQSLLKASQYIGRPINFGYYGITGWGQDFFQEVKSHSNTIWIASETGDPLEAKETIKIFEKIYLDLNTMAVLDVERIFFDSQLKLRPDAVSRWKLYSTKLKPYFHKILSIYPMDEPYGWGKAAGIGFEDMQKQMEAVASIIKASSFANIPLSISFTTRTTYLPIPKGYEWIGVDCYGSWDSCDGKSISQHNQVLKDKLLPHQKIILFADAGLRSTSMTFSETDENNLIDRLHKYFEYAQSDSKVAAVFAFIWQSIPSQNTIGARDIPRFKKEIVGLASKYLKNTSVVAISECASGQAEVPSNDKMNHCHFSWGRSKPGVVVSTADGTILSTGGGKASASCRSDGSYDFTWSCSNVGNYPKVCPAGYAKKVSLDKSNICDFSWALANEGDKILVTVSTNGGVLTGKCLPDGNWDFTYNCPGKVPSCDGGSFEILSSSDPTDKGKSCRFSWEPTPADQAAIGLKDIYGRGTASGYRCSSDGKSWKQGSYFCP